eukprot:scaffold563314_cov38-Prasinocladus_malaysianus.AAC.1
MGRHTYLVEEPIATCVYRWQCKLATTLGIPQSLQPKPCEPNDRMHCVSMVEAQSFSYIRLKVKEDTLLTQLICWRGKATASGQCS